MQIIESKRHVWHVRLFSMSGLVLLGLSMGSRAAFAQEAIVYPVFFREAEPSRFPVIFYEAAPTVLPEAETPLRAPFVPALPLAPAVPPLLKPPVAAGDSDRLGLIEAMAIVRRWHPSIRRSMSLVDQNKEHVKVARAGYFPALRANVRSGFDAQGNYDRKRTVNTDLVISATQTVYDFGQTASKVDFAEATLQKEQYGLERTLNQLLYGASNAFLEVVRYQRLVTVAQNQVAGFADINQIAAQRAVLGASAYSDYSQAKVRLAMAESLLYDVQGQLAKWSTILDNQANQRISARLRFDYPAALTNACMTVDFNDLDAPGLTVARAEETMAKIQLKAAKAAALPTLAISPTYEYRLNQEERLYQPKSRGRFGVFLNVSVPLMEGGAISARRQEARQALLAAQANVDLEKTEAVQKVMDAASQVQSTRHSLNAKRQREAGAVQTRDLYRLQYLELGNRPFSDLLNAEGEIYQTHMDIVNGTYTLQKLSIECLYQSGRLSNQLISLSDAPEP